MDYQYIKICGLLYIWTLLFRITFALDYTCLSGCKCATIDETHLDKVQVHCSVAQIANDTIDFRRIQTNHTTWLFLYCNNLLENRLFPGMLKHLMYLEELAFVNCRIDRLYSEVLMGLNNLKVLNITYSGTNHLQISDDLFKHIPNIDSLFLIQMGVHELPPTAFCGLRHLNEIDMSFNSFTAMDQLGFMQGEECLPNLENLSLTGNFIQNLTKPFSKFIPKIVNLDLKQNKISAIHHDTFNNLNYLQYLDLAFNALPWVSDDLFYETFNLRILNLYSNQLDCLDEDLFKNNLLLITVSLGKNRLTSECLPEVRQLNELYQLDLSKNFIDTIPIEYFHFENGSSLSELYLQENQLSDIPIGAFKYLNNLQTLNLTGNNLSRFNMEDIFGSSAEPTLVFLCLDNNKLTDEGLALSDIPYLQALYLSNNQFNHIPSSNFTYENLNILDLRDNQLSAMKATDFAIFPKLQYLSLGRNNISYIGRNLFRYCPELLLINLSENKITTIERSAFYGLNQLQILWLSHNQITEIDLIFDKLPRLHTLDLDNNLIKSVYGNEFPTNIFAVYLKFNKIEYLGPSLLKNLVNLNLMDLRGNQLQRINSQSLQIYPSAFDRVNIFLSNNLYICDCLMENINTIQKSYFVSSVYKYAKITDLSSIICKTVAVDYQFRFIEQMDDDEFLCQYCSQNDTQCGPLAMPCFNDIDCFCCGESDCPCARYCPDSCFCAFNRNHNYNLVNCSSSGKSAVPINLQHVTHLHLDGNTIGRLDTNSTSNLSVKLKEIYLNSSEIVTILPYTFQNLSNVEYIDLSHNRMTLVLNSTFLGLYRLKNLNLSTNNIFDIENGAFEGLSSFKVLDLTSNNLTEMDLSALEISNIEELYLANNPWSCDCNFGPYFQRWMAKYSHIVKDDPLCFTLDDAVELNTTEAWVKWVSFDHCKNLTNEIVLYSSIASVQLGVGLASAFLLIIIALLLTYRYKDLLEVWAYSRYGIRLYKTKEDDDKIYDAFISYSSYDEHFVVHELAAVLEKANPPYKLCVHYRDWLIGPSIAESVISSVYNSKRTILLLSKHFIQSEWCSYEFQTAHHQVLKDKTCRLIVILMDDEPPEGLDEQLTLYIKTHTYIKRSDKWFWERLKFAMPEVSPEQRAARIQNREMMDKERRIINETLEMINVNKKYGF